jgi:hypothetical protein
MRSAFKTVDTSKTSRILVNNEQNNEKQDHRFSNVSHNY